MKNLTTALLRGDNVLPTDKPDEVLALLSLAYNEIGNQADALHLFTLNKNENLIRASIGEFLIRTPELPVLDDDELDIDHELGFVASRFIASYLSKNKPEVHASEAARMITTYNQKVESVISKLEDAS